MKIYNTLDDFTKLDNAFVTVGTYDGVHKGHRKILETLVKESKANKAESVVISFWPHPKKILGSSTNEQELKFLSSPEEKIALLTTIGIDHFLIVPFTREFSDFSPEEYVSKVLIEKIGTKKIIIGYDHRFGKNREGSFDYLLANSTKFGIEVQEIPKQDLNDIAVSSTLIRKALMEGDVSGAAQYLENSYTLKGIVVKGRQLGRTIGFPTANLKVYDQDKLIPTDGVYAVKIYHKGSIRKGMLNIGVRPTVDGVGRTIEVNIFNFNEDIYGEELTIEFILRIRSEQKFPNVDVLKQQLVLDREKALLLLAE